MDPTQHPYTPARLRADLEALGLAPGRTIMLHASVRAIGPVMGGPNTILQAVLDVLTPARTVMMYAGWEDIPDTVHELPAHAQAIHLDQHPAFDPALARAVRENSVLAEFLRTWPGTRRSANPEASMVANGARAEWLTQGHAPDYGYGTASTLEKLTRVDGQVLLLGAPLDTLTCCTMRSSGADYLGQGGARQGRVGDAACYLFDAADLTDFAVDWLEARFGP